MSKNCPVLSLVLHLHHEACWCSEFWKQFLTVIHGQKKVFTVISTSTLCQSNGREYSLYMRAWLTHCIHPEMMPCHTDDALFCSRSMVRLICCINDIFPATRCWTFKTGPKCSTSGEWDLYPATQAAKASFTAFLHHFRSQATKRARRRTPWMSELSSRLLKSLLYEDLSSKTMSAAGDLSAAAQHLPDVERRRCWSILEAGCLSLIPSPYAKRPEKRWLCTRCSSFCWEKRVAVEALLLVMGPFRTEAVLTVLHRNDPPWPRLDSV